MIDLFRQYDAAYNQFTFYDGEPDQQVLQVGLTGMFRLGDGGTPLGRKRIAGVFNYFHKQFGQHLKYGYFTDPNRLLKYGAKAMVEKQKQILSQNGGDLEFSWKSGDDHELVNKYQFSVYSPAQWFQDIHQSVSVVYFYIPLQTLKDNAIDFDEWIRFFCEILQPLSGFFGLALQQCYERYRYQHIEFEVAQKFLGLHIITGGWDKEFRDGIDSVNWYTFFNRNWLNQLGGEAALKHTLNDERIKMLPYEGGMIIKAGELPELGWIEEDPYPELYVKVNHALKPIRAPKIESLGYGSIAGEIRFNDRTTAEWLTRFDNAPLPPETTVPPTVQRENLSENRVFIMRESGEIAPHSGLWATLQNGVSEYLEIDENTVIPEWLNKRDNKMYKTTWTLIRREDGGDCTVPSN